MSFPISLYGGSRKGVVKRSVLDEMSLRVRILNGRHVMDVLQRATDEMGERGRTLGPMDLSRNTLVDYVDARATAYLGAPYVGGLSDDLAMAIGDHSASVTIAKFAAADGRPMPTEMREVSRETQRYAIGCNYAGTMIGWSDRTRHVYLETVTPDDLRVEYLSDDPREPTVIARRVYRRVRGDEIEVWDTWDLTDMDAPSFRVMSGDDDITMDALGSEYTGEGYWWRYVDGTPYHPIVLEGDPRQPYRRMRLADATLSVSAAWTHWRAGLLDAAYPKLHAIGMSVDGMSMDGEDAGHATGPEVVTRWRHDDPERPGSLMQVGPGFDPEAIARAINSYTQQIVSASPMHMQMESVGGEPAQIEADAMRRVAESYYDPARTHDGEVLRRVAATINRATAILAESGEDIEPTEHDEIVLGVLYGSEVAELLGSDDEEDQDGGE